MKYCLMMWGQAKNRLGRTNEVAPIQELLGIDPLTTCSVIQLVADLKVKYVANQELTRNNLSRQKEQIRATAHAAFACLDAHEKRRVGLNSRSRPPRLAELHEGAQAWVRNRPAGQDRHWLQDFGKVQLETHRDDKCWEGPGYVVKAESITSIWVRIRERLRKCAVENIRLATPD